MFAFDQCGKMLVGFRGQDLWGGLFLLIVQLDEGGCNLGVDMAKILSDPCGQRPSSSFKFVI